MSQWTSSSYTKRLTYELRDTTPKGRARLQATMKSVEDHLWETRNDADEKQEDEWILLLRTYEKATELLQSSGQMDDLKTGGLMYGATGGV